MLEGMILTYICPCKLGQIRIHIAYIRLRGAQFRIAEGREGRGEEGKGRGVPGGCSSPEKGPTKNWRRAPPLAQPSPPGWKYVTGAVVPQSIRKIGLGSLHFVAAFPRGPVRYSGPTCCLTTRET
jgi:hypothetical protein